MASAVGTAVRPLAGRAFRSFRLSLFAALIVSRLAFAGPVVVDLTDEKKEFEAKETPRKLGLGFFAGTLVVAGTSAVCFAVADGNRSRLLAERTPVDIPKRQLLVDQGQIANVTGVIGIVVALLLAGVTTYFLSASF